MSLDLAQTRLNNGILVVSDTAPSFEGVSIECTLPVGAMDDPDGKEGLAHILEHLLFRGSEKRTGEKIQSAFDEMGGRINASVDEDSTTVRATVLHEDLDRALEIIGDLMSRPRCEPEDIGLEKQIVEQENCRGCWNCTMREGFLDTAFPGHPIARPILGSEESVDAITRDDLLAFHSRHYRTDGLVIAVAGAGAGDLLLSSEPVIVASGRRRQMPRFPDIRAVLSGRT